MKFANFAKEHAVSLILGGGITMLCAVLGSIPAIGFTGSLIFMGVGLSIVLVTVFFAKRA